MGADQEIDLIELAQKLWQGRRMIVKWCLAGALAGARHRVQHPEGVYGYGEAGP